MDGKAKRANELLRKIQKGDEKALRALYTELGPRLFAVAKKYVSRSADAEDVLSDIFYDLAVKRAGSFDERKNGLNWLFKIVRNKAIAYNKRYSLLSPMPEDVKAEDCVRDDEELADLKRALENLTEGENRIVRLHFWEGLTIREIAKELGEKHTTVFYAYQKALKKIEKYLNGTAGK